MPQLVRQVTHRLVFRRSSRSISALFPLAIVSAVLLVVTACAGLNDNGSQMDTLETMEARENAPPPSPPPSGSPSGSPAAQPAGDPAVGQQVYQANCASCHSIDGSTIVGPTWQGLYGSQIPLESGETVTADDAYIHESIVAPNAKIHQGFPPAMPPFAGILTEEQIAGVIAYIKTLE